MASLLTDIRFGLRILRKNPGFAAIAILTLGLGIGATTVVFSVLDNVSARLKHDIPASNEGCHVG